jgi:glutamate-5-semialdehyde dehydrogenase
MNADIRRMTVDARDAQRRLAAAGPAARSSVLQCAWELLAAREEAILEANRRDLAVAEQEGLSGPLLHRLSLSPEKLATLRRGVEQLATGPDPVGTVRRATELADGLVLRQVSSPLGVVLVIFESRPEAVIQIGSLALRAGDGLLLKGGREATASNAALVGCLRDALVAGGLAPAAVQAVEGRRAVHELLEQDDLIDLVIPRGSGELVRTIQGSTRIPVLGHAEGVCHLFVDATAEPAMAAHLAVDGKCDYPAACNATETLLVHRRWLPHLAELAHVLAGSGVALVGDAQALPHLPGGRLASDRDWGREWGDLTLSVRVVASFEEAVDHIHRHGSGHTDAIVTADPSVAERFLATVDSASVFVNASTRFADGYRYGLGAEVGISTSRIHARGPVGVEGLLTTRWLLEGSGEGASDFGPGRRAYSHRSLPVTAAGSGR